MKKIIYIDMDDVLCDFQGAFREAIERTPSIMFPQSQYGFFRNLKPLKGAVEAVNALSSDKRYDVYILTAPSVLNPLCYTEKRLWVEDYFGMEMVHRLIITPNKGLNRGDYLIDDFSEGKGQEEFEGILIQFGGKGYETWHHVLAYFNKG